MPFISRRAPGVERTGIITAKNLYGALDAGLDVNSALIENQIVDMMVQATSRMLKEEMKFSQSHFTSLDWETCRVVRLAEHPNATPVVNASTSRRLARARRLWARRGPPSRMPSSARPASACGNIR